MRRYGNAGKVIAGSNLGRPVSVETQWPSIRDVAHDLRVSTVYVLMLIHDRRLHAIRTRLGWLVDPASVTDYARTRVPTNVP